MIKMNERLSHSVPGTLILTSCLQLALCDDEGRAKMTLQMHTYNFKVQLLEYSGVFYLSNHVWTFYKSVSLVMEHRCVTT